MKQLKLPTVLKETTRFYKDHEELLKPYLGRPYLSYSSKNSFEGYENSFIKEKIAKLPKVSNIYADMGSYLGKAVEKGVFPEENPHRFTGQENLGKVPRPDNAEYEKMILIDRGSYIIIGFIDICEDTDEGVNVGDLKTGGKDKEKTYASEGYIQIPLYAVGLEEQGKNINKTYVWFVRRTGSHFKPPLHISDEQFEIEVPYNKEIGKKALEAMDIAAKEISCIYTTYSKIFK